jgi:hypothetical protein
MEECDKAKRGYSRDSRPDCVQVVIALIVTPDGFPLAYEVMTTSADEMQTLSPDKATIHLRLWSGNTSEQKTLQPFLDRIEKAYGPGTAGVGDGSRHTHGSDAEKDARAEDIVSGGHAERQHQ